MAASKRVGLLVTCLVDLFRPSVGFAAATLLEDAGCTVEVPSQTCCGQPAFNSGDRATAREIAEQVIAAFEPFDYVVAPSGSCAGQVRVHYPELFAGDPAWQPRADALAAKTYELTQFLVDVLEVKTLAARCEATTTFHDSCSCLRELGVRTAPRALLASVDGLTLTEIADGEACCGFGGTFAIKYPAISNAMVAKKADAVSATGASLLLSADLGCLMNIVGKLQREGRPVAARHVAEVLAGALDQPPIGMPAASETPSDAKADAEPPAEKPQAGGERADVNTAEAQP
ncbi:putative L-lactate dehydrogenase [Rhodovulum sp. PH10]|uniref:(Fe-S)-binding protein n=1 Tax=Rhodovulum sp. PH10 TaxID=1187851 RepID=UPI00027C21D0|nr:(Fe-S)-binding protein [Rhodovulum sp. PH10]EJW11970.1 putative L-lactate dehydrogenase [Rhodovulum sp. PH10]